jgi:hypothetical protein
MATKKKDVAVVDGNFTMIKYPGKGGWTYISIPDFGDNKKTRFAYRKINLVIDGLKIDNTSIWKMKNGNYFLPVKAEIRKKIGKQEGDSVHVQLFKVSEVLESDEEIILCLKEEPTALKRWKTLPDEERTRLTDWILSAPKEQIKVDRLADLINDLLSSRKIKT